MTPTVIIALVAGCLVSAFLGLLIGRIAKGGAFTWNLKDTIGIALIGSFIGVIFILFWKAIPASNEQLLVYMLGQLSGFVAGVVSSHYVTKAGEDKLAERRQDTTKAAFEAITAAANSVPLKADDAAADAAQDVAGAAAERADEIAGENQT